MVAFKGKDAILAQIPSFPLVAVATLYISDPWYIPASASFGSYQMKSITALTAPASNFNGPLSQLAVNESTIVPANFALSFDIKPLGTVSGWGSIIHYSKDKTDIGPGGRIPGTAFENTKN